MPVSSTSYLRTFIQKVNKTEVTVPDYAVLFYYDKIKNWNSTYSGVLNKDYYISLSIKTNNFNSTSPVDWPLVYCVDNYNIDSAVGIYSSANLSISSFIGTGTLLDTAGGHNPTAAGFQTQTTLGFGFNNGDTASSNSADVYYMLTNAQGGHLHEVAGTDIANTVLNIKNLSANGILMPQNVANLETIGIPQATVNMLLKDPTIKTGTTILTFLPKNIIVLGNNLPSNFYSRIDPLYTTTQSVNNIPLRNNDILSNTYYLSCYSDASGSYFNTSTNFTLSSNNAPLHDHSVASTSSTGGSGRTTSGYASAAAGSSTSASRKSNRTGQTASLFGLSGRHNHPVTYNVSAYIKGKKLKAYFTNNDKTPIANGVILGYCPSAAYGYTGTSYATNLPPHWHVCDGNNGTPDLRGFYIGANFNDSDHNVNITILENKMKINSITVAANGAHSHGVIGAVNTPGPVGSPKILEVIYLNL